MFILRTCLMNFAAQSWMCSLMRLQLIRNFSRCRLRRVHLSSSVHIRGFAQDVRPWIACLFPVFVQYIRLCCKYIFWCSQYFTLVTNAESNYSRNLSMLIYFFQSINQSVSQSIRAPNMSTWQLSTYYNSHCLHEVSSNFSGSVLFGPCWHIIKYLSFSIY